MSGLVRRYEVGPDGGDYVTDADAVKLEAVVEAARSLQAETAPISGDYRHWSCQVCGVDWTQEPTEAVRHPLTDQCAWLAFDRTVAELRREDGEGA